MSRKKTVDELKIIKLYVDEGFSSRKIAKKTSHALTTIQRILKKHNVTRNLKEARANLFQKGYKHPFKKELDENKVICLYTKENVSIPNISKMFNCSLAPILRVLRKNKVPTKSSSESHKGNPGYWTGKKRLDISVKLKGIKRSNETKEKLKLSHLGQISTKRGKTYEHFYGEENAKKLKRKLSSSHKGQISTQKGKTFEQLFGTERAEKIKDQLREATLKQYEGGDFPKQTHTKPEMIFKEELINRGYTEKKDFIHQFKFANKFMCDFAFPNQKIIVECDGDFFHCNPKKFDPENLKPQQKRTVSRDKAKSSYINKYNHGSWTLLRFWECDIHKDIIKCVDEVEKVIRLKTTIKLSLK